MHIIPILCLQYIIRIKYRYNFTIITNTKIIRI